MDRDEAATYANLNLEKIKALSGKKCTGYDMCPFCRKKQLHLATHLDRNCSKRRFPPAMANQIAKAVKRGDYEKEEDQEEMEQTEEDEVELEAESENSIVEDSEEVVVDKSVKPKPSYELENTIAVFEKWLMTIDGKSRAPATASQYSGFVQNIILSGMNGDLNQLHLYPNLYKHGGYLTELQKTKAPQTLSTNLYALMAFLEFVEYNQATHPYLSKEECQEGHKTLKRWDISLRGDKAAQKHEHAEKEDAAVPLVADLIALYATSKHCVKGVKLVADMQLSADPPSPSTFLHVRNYIIMKLLCRNVQRAGPILNATMGEYRGMVEHKDHFALVVSIIDCDQLNKSSLIPSLCGNLSFFLNNNCSSYR